MIYDMQRLQIKWAKCHHLWHFLEFWKICPRVDGPLLY